MQDLTTPTMVRRELEELGYAILGRVRMGASEEEVAKFAAKEFFELSQRFGDQMKTRIKKGVLNLLIKDQETAESITTMREYWWRHEMLSNDLQKMLLEDLRTPLLKEGWQLYYDQPRPPACR